MSALTPNQDQTTGAPPPSAAGRDKARRRGLDERPYIYLLYLLFYFTSWFFQPPSWIDSVVGIVAALIFAFVYVFAMEQGSASTKAQGWIVFGAASFALGLSLGLTPFNGMSGTYAIYAVTLCASLRPSDRALVAMVAAGLVYLGGSLFIRYGPLEIHISLFEITLTAFISALAGLATWSGFQTSQRMDLRERRLRLDAELAAARERERIARDLHDVLGHTLTTIAVKSDLAARLLGQDDGAARREIEDIRDASRASLKEVRAAVAGMHRTTIGMEIDRAKSALESGGVDLIIKGEAATLTSQSASALGLALREAVTNVLRHAEARTVTLTLSHTASETWMSVEDDGAGEIIEAGGGLTGMRGRLEALGGDLKIERGKAGVRLVMRLPLKPGLEQA